MIEASTEFVKSGYEDHAIQLGKVAMMYANVADEAISAGDASNFIISQMKAFNIEAENAERIIDSVNAVSNKFAVSSADIANNLGVASSVMANAGNSLEEYIGLMTAGTEITRNANRMSTGLRTVDKLPLYTVTYKVYPLNCWELLRAFLLQRKFEIKLSVNV